MIGLADRPAELSRADFEKLRVLIESTLGISMPHSKRAMLETRLMRRLRDLHFATFKEYCRYLESDAGRGTEVPQLLDLVTTNKTSFFREAPQLELLGREFLPPLYAAARDASREFRVWSAACASGQEVWTLVLMLEDLDERLRGNGNFLVMGSDVSRRVLRTAIAAKYHDDELTDVPPTYAKFFMRSKQATSPLVRLIPEARRHAAFFRQNLMNSEYSAAKGLDVILLRNALIYFSRERQHEIVARVIRHLRPGGLFLVSLTESLHGFPLPLTHLGRSIYRLEGA